MDKVIKRFKNIMLGSLVMALLDVIIGLVFILCTQLATKVNVIILGSLVVVHGLFYIIRYLYDGLGNKFFAIDLVTGVIAIILGVFTIFNPFEALHAIGVLFGIWLFVFALEHAFYGFKFLERQEEIYPLVCFISILLVIMGILVIVNPFIMFMLITRLIGLFMICSGLFEALICMLFRKRANKLLELFE